MLIIAPGQWTEWTPLNEAAHAARESEQREVRMRLEKRRANGAAESDDVDYGRVRIALEDAVKAAKIGVDSLIRGHVQVALDLMASGIQVPEDFEPVPGSDDVEIRVKTVSRARYQALQAKAFSDNIRGDEYEVLAPLFDMFEECVEIRGLALDEGSEASHHIDRDAKLWDHANLTGTIWLVLRNFQTLSFDEKKRFGSRREQT